MKGTTLIAEARAANARLFRAPGRVNIIGEHSDYNDGLVLPTNTALYTWLMIKPRADRTVRVNTRNLEDTQSFSLDDIRRNENPGWLDYLKGVAAGITAKGIRLSGAEITIDSDIPIGGGLSSSASLELATATAMLAISGATLPPLEIATLCLQAEQRYAGVNCGIMDQYSVACCNRGEAIRLDCRSLEATSVSIPGEISLLITDSSVKHNLVEGGLNNRAGECTEAVARLAEFIPGISALRDVSTEQLDQHGARLDTMLHRRSRHVVSEIERVRQAFEALQANDAEKLGTLISASHASLRDDFEVSCDEIEALVTIADSCDGVLGSRVVGAGFGGCVLSVTRTDMLDDAIRQITARYRDVIGKAPWVHVVSVTDPVQEFNLQ